MVNKADDPGNFEKAVEILRDRFPDIAKIASDRVLPSPLRRDLLLSAVRERYFSLKEHEAELDKELVTAERNHAAIVDALNWAKENSFSLQRCECSCLHTLRAEISIATMCGDKKDALTRELSQWPWPDTQVFLVEHNWAKAFSGAGDFTGGELKLPFERCAFEFRVSGRSVVCLLRQIDGGYPLGVIATRTKFSWVCIALDAGAAELGEYEKFLLAQIRAILIALDVEIVVSQLTRAPHRLNSAREKVGKLPIYDHHTLSLAHRHRTPQAPSDGNEQKRKRLHFRRGHWRHYATFKTWIKWTLVGDPDLGFIEKDYRL